MYRAFAYRSISILHYSLQVLESKDLISWTEQKFLIVTVPYKFNHPLVLHHKYNHLQIGDLRGMFGLVMVNMQMLREKLKVLDMSYGHGTGGSVPHAFPP